jgi:hypothetical protein
MLASAAGYSACQEESALPTARPEGPLKHSAVHRKKRKRSRGVHTLTQQRPRTVCLQRCTCPEAAEASSHPKCLLYPCTTTRRRKEGVAVQFHALILG